MSDRFNFTQSLTCVACGDTLIGPITLSCGYTVCSHCFPITSPTSVKKSVFRCPVPHCDAATHIFGPELLSDVTITELTSIFRDFLPKYSQLPFNDLINNIRSMEFPISSIIPLLKCHICTAPVSDAITIPCGHTFCRLCVLRSKTCTDQCNICCRPLPKFSSLLAQAHSQLITGIVKEFQLSGLLPYNIQEISLLDSVHLQQCNIPLFISGTIILPGQKFRLPIFTPNHLRMFHNALIPCSRYKGLCLAAVHRSRPHIAQFGTILQIIGLEHRNNALLIEVIGLERFKLDTHYEQGETMLIGNLTILYEDFIRQLCIDVPNSSSANDHQGVRKQQEQVSAYAVSLADTLIQFIQHLGSPSYIPVSTLHTQTAGLLGPLWYESIKSIHGLVPSKYDPAAVCWWVAMVLPVPPSDLYTLLRTVPVIDRLELVVSWIQALQSQWVQCRSTAIYAFNQITQQEQL